MLPVLCQRVLTLPSPRRCVLTLSYHHRNSAEFGSIFMLVTKLRRAAARSAEGARSALRREAPVARGRAKLRRISSLSFCTLHHFSSLYHL